MLGAGKLVRTQGEPARDQADLHAEGGTGKHGFVEDEGKGRAGRGGDPFDQGSVLQGEFRVAAETVGKAAEFPVDFERGAAGRKEIYSHIFNV